MAGKPSSNSRRPKTDCSSSSTGLICRARWLCAARRLLLKRGVPSRPPSIDQRATRVRSSGVDMNFAPHKIALRSVALGLLLTMVGCDEDRTEPEERSPPEIPAPTTPENVVKGIYNDDVRNPQERIAAYANLLSASDSDPSEAFTFNFMPVDIPNGLPPSWGVDAELAAHRDI